MADLPEVSCHSNVIVIVIVKKFFYGIIDRGVITELIHTFYQNKGQL